MAEGVVRAAVPALHIVTDDRVLAGERFPALATALLQDGGARVALHLRGPTTGVRHLHRLAAVLEPKARRAGGWLVVNDRVDVALVTGVPNVHLGARSMMATDARVVLPRGSGIGVSTHGPDAAAVAAREGADWIFAGTIYRTPSHPGRGGVGPEGLKAAVEGAAGVPTLAIGGLTPVRVQEVLAVGAWGVAVISGVWSAPDPIAALNEYLDALHTGEGRSQS